MQQRVLAAYTDFRGGLNTDAAPDKVADQELMQADNVDLDERGALKKMKGTTALNITSYGAQVEQLIEWPKNDGTKILLAVIGTKLCKIDQTNGAKTDIQTLSSAYIGYFFLQDKFYFTDGDKYRVYDGTTVTDVSPKDKKSDGTAITDNDLAPIKRCKYMLWNPKSFRIFYAGDSQDPAAMYYSEPNEPNYVKGTSKLYPTTGDGPVKGLELFGDSLLVFYQNSVWKWEGVDPATDVTWGKLPVGQGCIAPKAIGLTPNSLTFPGIGGLYALSPGALNSDFNVIMVTGDELIRNISKDKVGSIFRSTVHPETMSAVYDKYNERYLLSYGDDPTNPRNNRVLVLDWGLQAFTRYADWMVNDFCQLSDGTLLLACNGYIVKANHGSNHFNADTSEYIPITMRIKSKQFNLGYPFHEKKTKKVYVAAKQYDVEESSVNICVNSDYGDICYLDATLDDSFTWGETWGNMWGYSDYTTKEMKAKLKGFRFQIEITNEKLNEPVTLYGFAFESKVNKPKGVKVNET